MALCRPKDERAVSTRIRGLVSSTHFMGIFHAAAGIWASWILIWAEPSPSIQAGAWFCGVLALGMAVARVPMHFLSQPRWAAGVAKMSIAFGLFYAGILGTLAFMVLRQSDIPGLRMVIAATAVAFAAGAVTNRTLSSSTALAQLFLCLVPITTGLILSGDTYQQIFGATLTGFIAAMAHQAITTGSDSKKAAITSRSLDSQTRLFHAAISNMSHGLLMIDPVGRVLVWNDKLVELTGARQGNFEVGMTLSRFLTSLRSDAAGRSALVRALILQIRNPGDAEAVRVGSNPCLSISRRHTAQGETVLVVEDVTEQTRATQEIRRLASTDDLTGLLNRGAMRERALELLGRGAVAVHLIDLDHFKAVNDTLGHPVGDRVLVEVAERLSNASGDDVLVGRMGGDEFILLQPISESWEPASLGNQILVSLCTAIDVDGTELDMGASLGTAESPRDGIDFDVLLAKADKALYEAKRLGRNRQVFYEPHLDLQAQKHLEMELRIAEGLRNDEFSLRYQPIVDAGTGRVLSFEALMRWDRENASISPSEFIPIAEDTGQIIPLGRWAVERACRDAVLWSGIASVAINFSARQFADISFPDFLASVIERTGINPGRIELEITETALLEKSEKTLDMLNAFKNAGVKVCLDDFGAGFSSLSHLRLFPFDKIKVDGSFVRDMGKNTGADAVVHSLAYMGRQLGVPVVAEWVETPEQLMMVRAAGCTQAQGYLLGRPARASAIEAVLASNVSLLACCEPQALAG